MSVHYENIEEIEAVVRGFESCSTGKEEFTHASHLTVAAWYLHHHTFEQAVGKMRSGLFRFLDHHEVPPGKYNETITLFWLKVVNASAVRQTGSSFSPTSEPTWGPDQLVSTANELIQSFGTSQLLFDYYSKSRISSPEAKSGWVEPDLKPFDFRLEAR